MPKKITPLLLVLLILNTLVACDLGDLRLVAQFNKIHGLESGDRIIYRDKYIGDVEEITRSEQGPYLVELDVDADHREQLTVYSIFYIYNDPDYPERQAVFTEQRRSGGILLTDGSVVAGLDHPPHLRNMLDELKRKTEELAEGLAEKLGRARDTYERQSPKVAQQLEESLAAIERQLRDLEKTIRTAPNSEEARNLKRNIDKLVTGLESSLEQVKTLISRDLLNSLNESLNNLQQQLNELNREERSPPEPKDGNEGAATI